MNERTVSGGRNQPVLSFRRVWFLCFALFAVVIAAWSLGTPLDGAPDERAHIVKAAAVVRGQWLGSEPPGAPSDAFTQVRVPKVYNDPGINGCFIGHPSQPAGCPDVHPPSSQTVTASTYVGHYPPTYYLLVGWPTFLGTKSSWYLVRLLSALWNAAMLALAVASAYRWSRSGMLLAAVAVAVTPMTVFLAAAVNPNGLEISAAVAMWTTATVWVVDHPRHPPPGLMAAVAVGTSVLVLIRGLSPLWPALCVATLLPLAWRRVPVRALATRVGVRVAAAAVAISGVAGVAWIVLANGLAVVAQGVPSPTTTRLTIARTVAGDYGNLIHQAIGVFGWLDTPSPALTYLMWLGVGGGLVGVAVLIGYRPALVSLAVAIGLSGAVPFILTNIAARHSGLGVQARYYLPLAVSIPIVAGAVSNQVGLPGRGVARLATTIIWLTALGQIAAAVWTLRRYLVGESGPLWPTATVPDVWHPPVAGWLLDLVSTLGWCGIAVVLVGLSRRMPMVWRATSATDFEPATRGHG